MSKKSKPDLVWVPSQASKELLLARNEDRLVYHSCLNNTNREPLLLEVDEAGTGIFEVAEELSSYKLVILNNQALVSQETTFGLHIILPAPRTSYPPTAYFRFALSSGPFWELLIDGSTYSEGLEKTLEERGGRKYPKPVFTTARNKKRVAIAPTDEQKRLRQAEREGRVATVRGNNNTKLPLNLSFDHSRVKLENVRDDQTEFELHMVTRRTMLNPGEYFLAKVVLQQPTAELPETSSIRLPLHKEQLDTSWNLSLKGLSTDELNAKLKETASDEVTDDESLKLDDGSGENQ